MIEHTYLARFHYLLVNSTNLLAKTKKPLKQNNVTIASTYFKINKKHGHKITMFSLYSYNCVCTKSYLLINSLLIFSASSMYSVLMPLLTPHQKKPSARHVMTTISQPNVRIFFPPNFSLPI